MVSTSFAESRFGLGARGDQPIPQSDPRGWAEVQLAAFEPHVAGIPDSRSVAVELADYLDLQKAARQLAKDQQAMIPSQPQHQPQQAAASLMMPAAMPRPARTPEIIAARQAGREAYATLVGARTNNALMTTTPFAERLTHFWANHFAVSANKQTTIGFAGLLEFEAIRPHVMGKFGDMLLAVEQHPAMLFFLDQVTSIGPDSMFAQRGRNRARRGLNENLAREIMELHTLGVRTGYSQADVTEFARALTGWTVAGIGRGQAAQLTQGEPGQFAFVDGLHEPGDRMIMGKRYRDGGQDQARAILSDLAVHPATARHLATKLARHFAADNPPPAMVARLEAAYRKSGGDLPTIYRALIASPEAWDSATPKFRNPWDWTVASLRAVGVERIDGDATSNLLNQLGQPVWRPDSPAGYDDIAAAWAGPDALVRRVEAAQRLAARAGSKLDARLIAPRVLGAQLTPATATAIARSESPGTGLALMLVSPEFLRR
ncbi:MAG: DUF1800 domain-containing protein [Sphingomicrobium sp.]